MVSLLKLVLATLNAKYIHSSLALRYLRAYCEPTCPSITIKEYTINNKLLEILSDLFETQPQVLGLACYIWNIEMTVMLARLVKQVMPNTVIILGGPEVTYDPQEILEKHAAVDYVIQGEGEAPLAALLRQLNGRSEIQEITGVVSRNSVTTSGAQVMKCLDDIPFPYNSADLDTLRDKIVYYESSRGCPFSCQYCLSSATSGVRYFSTERVLQDLQILINAKVRQVKFVDRTFNASKSHYLPILRFLAKQDCKTNFHLEIAADILDAEAIDVLTEAPTGRFQLEIGVQSTHEPTLAAIQRHNNWERLTTNVKRLRQIGHLHLHLDLIVGLPFESYCRFGQSFNDVYRLQPHMLQIGFLKVLKGSGIRRGAEEHNYVFADFAPYEVLQNNYMNYREIRKLQILEEVFNQTYNSGRYEYTLRLLVELEDNQPFALFEALTLYWEERNLHRMAHSAKSVTAYVVEFCRSRYSEQMDLVEELLKFDALVSEGGKLRPEFLPWNQEVWQAQINNFWRNEAIVRSYLPEYTFTTWRELKRLYHIEVFSSAAMQRIVPNHMLIENQTAVLFDYREDQVRWSIVNAPDFRLEDSGYAL